MTSEEARLDDAMMKGDQILVSSLKREDEERKRRRRKIFLGIVAAMVITTAVMGGMMWWVFTGPNRIDPRAVPIKVQSESEKLQEADDLTTEGWGLWQGGNPASAVSRFKRALELNPKSENALNGLGWASFNSGNWKTAENAFTRLLAINPDHPAALNGIGQLNLARGDFAKAELSLLKAAPQAPAAWWGLTRLYLVEGRYADAQKWAQKIWDSGDKTIAPLLEAAKAQKLDDELRRQISPSTRNS